MLLGYYRPGPIRNLEIMSPACNGVFYSWELVVGTCLAAAYGTTCEATILLGRLEMRLMTYRDHCRRRVCGIADVASIV